VGRDQIVTVHPLAGGAPLRLVGQMLFSLRLPTQLQLSKPPIWDFDFRCVGGARKDCWIAVPLTVGRLALYRLGYE
jgi:hypothetical protein